MKIIRATAIGIVAILLASFAPAQEKRAEPPQEKKIAMTPVSYDGLKQEVLKQRGKVLVVDFWASTCVPCIKDGLPHMKEMYKAYSDRGLAIITVSTDDATDEDKVNSANKTLNRLGLPFRHVNLADPMGSDRLKIVSLPCYYVFDRNGRWVRFGGDLNSPYSYEEIEKTVVKMLNEK